MQGGFKIAAFYRFIPVADPAALQTPLAAALSQVNAKGSVLLAAEGINGTIAAVPSALELALGDIRRITGAFDLEVKYSFADAMPFRRLKVRLKKEIVTIGGVKADPNQKVGTYVAPDQWNDLISDPDVVVVDTRNAYEVKIGSFQNAIDPGTESFCDFPQFVRSRLGNAKHKKIAMFCTGGIRCEKASSFMLHEGFEQVYHLQGGILKYLEAIKPEESLWQGACFVFDQRVAVEHGLAVSNYMICHGCLNPVSAQDRASENHEEGVCCVACADRLSAEQKASNRERQRQVVLAAERGAHHLGPKVGGK